MNDDALKSGTQDIVVDEVFPHAPVTSDRVREHRRTRAADPEPGTVELIS